MCADGPLEARGTGAAAAFTGSADAAFSRLYAEQFERVYGLLGRYGVAPADVEDLVQQVFSVAFARQNELAELENPRAWLTAVAVRVAHEHYRRRRVRRLKAWIVEHSWASRATDDVTPEHEALKSEAGARVREVLERMSDKLRDALVLVELEELGTREAAAILSIPHNTLRSRQRLARAEFERLWRIQERERERPR